MQVNIYEAKAKLSQLIDSAQKGEEVILARRKVPVARIVPEGQRTSTRIGGLAGRKLRMTDAFDSEVSNQGMIRDFYSE